MQNLNRPALTIAIVQARMGSTRLPGKTMAPIGGRPLLAHLLERLGYCKLLDGIMVATTTLPQDKCITSLAVSMGHMVFRGSADDVLGRFYGAAKKAHADFIVRICGDSPCVDPVEIDNLIRFRRKNKLDHAYLQDYPDGLDAEVFTFKALEFANKYAIVDSDREHVTPGIWRYPERWRTLGMRCPYPDANQYRWCVDDERDLSVVNAMFGALYDQTFAFALKQMIEYAQANEAQAMANAQTQKRNSGYARSVADTGRPLSARERQVLGIE